MAYWRMQLHPDRPKEALRYCVESLAAGYIGLDFRQDIGDLMKADRTCLPENQSDYWLFAHEMGVGDTVLIIAHHFPFALATVSGEYNYIRRTSPEIGVWFRHFRQVKDVRYYGDFVTNAGKWRQLKMTDTIAPLRDRQSQSYLLIEEWINS